MIILSKVHLKCHSLFGCQMLQALRLLSDDTTISKIGSISKVTFQQLGFSEQDSEELCNFKNLQKCTPVGLKNTLHTLQRLGFTKEDILSYPTILKSDSNLIVRRFKLLEECGVKTKKISLYLIRRFLFFSKKSAHSLKENHIIDQNINITRNILSYSDLPIHLYPSETDDSQPLQEIQLNAVNYYLQWLLDSTKEEIDKKWRTYQCSYKHRCIRDIKQSYYILQNNLEFSKEKIRQHIYLLQNNPERLLCNVERVPFINSKPLKDVAYLYPKMLTRPAETILEILQILKDFNIDSKNATHYPEMFSMAPETVRERLHILTTDPQYKYLIHNSRIFQSITNFKRMTYRSNLLKDSKWRCYSADLINGGQPVFDERIRLKHDHYDGTDIVHFLNKKISLPPKKILKIMSQHVLWNCVPLETISSTLEFLQENGFSQRQIISALPVILYPRSEVQKCLTGLDGNPEVDCCRTSSGKVRSELVLQLVLYFLERPFHFTGNGVWELDPLHTDQPQ